MNRLGKTMTMQTRMTQQEDLDSEEIGVAMKRVGYTRRAPRTFVADWTEPEISNIIFVHTFSYAGPAFIAAPKFAVKHHEAEGLVRQCYDGMMRDIWPTHRISRISRYQTSMSFELGLAMKDVGVESLWPIPFREWTPRQFAEKLQNDVTMHVLPAAKSIRGETDLYRFLLDDHNIARWFRCNGALRAGLIAYCGGRIGLPQESIERDLLRWSDEIDRAVRPRSGRDFLQLVFSKIKRD